MIETAATPIQFNDTKTAFADKSNLKLRRMQVLFGTMKYPWLVKSGTTLVEAGMHIGLPLGLALKPTLFKQFCGGESIEQCNATIHQLGESGIGSILDYSVEGATDNKGFDKTVQEIARTIERAAGDDNIPFAVFKCSGLVNVRILEKKQANQPLTAAEITDFAQFEQRVDKLCYLAEKKNVRVFIDAEESWIQEPIDELALQMMRKYNHTQPIVYNTYQMYLHPKLAQLKFDYQRAASEGFTLGVKLVRGAYMEKERARANEMNYTDPVQPSKAATDADYNAALAYAIEHINHFAICAGSHNEYSCYYLTELMHKAELPNNDTRVYFSQLLGMSDNITYILAAANYNVVKYVPYGPLKKVLPYLFRRAQENTAIAGQTSRELQLINKEIKRRSQTNS